MAVPVSGLAFSVLTGAATHEGPTDRQNAGHRRSQPKRTLRRARERRRRRSPHNARDKTSLHCPSETQTDGRSKSGAQLLLDFSEFLREGRSNMRILSVDQASPTCFLGRPNCGVAELGPIDLPNSGRVEVVCPKPFRPRASHMVDYVDRNRSRQEGGLASDLLDPFLAEHDREDIPDVSGRDWGFLSCSPPQRTDNPLVYDALFMSRTLPYPFCSSPGVNRQ